MTLGILFWAYQTYAVKQKTASEDNQLKGWELFSNAKLYIDEIYAGLFVKPIEFLASAGYRFFEKGFLFRSVNIFSKIFDFSGALIVKIQTGMLSGYIMWMIVGFICFIGYFIINSQFWN
jgi:NADH-quinone oxidoreductase subunit L